MQLLLVVLAFSYACATPHLLISKHLLNEYIVEGKDLTVQYSLYNIGSRWATIRIISSTSCDNLSHSTAQSVTLEDDTFPPDEFESVQGLLTVKWDRINVYPLYFFLNNAQYDVVSTLALVR